MDRTSPGDALVGAAWIRRDVLRDGHASRGQWRVCMQSPDGVEHWVHGVYNAVCEPEMLLLSLTWQAAAESPALESVISLRFADEGQKTRLTFEQTIIETE